MNYTEAMEILAQSINNKVKRSGWEGHLSMIPGNYRDVAYLPEVYVYLLRAGGKRDQHPVFIRWLPHKTVPGWQPSEDDRVATDWEVYGYTQFSFASAQLERQ